MANPFKGIGTRLIASFKQVGSKFKQIIAPHSSSPKAPTSLPRIQPPKDTHRIRSRDMTEYTATERALWAIKNALENPDDPTAQLGRKKAIEYLSRSQNLKGKGRLQDKNRKSVAQRWIDSDLSSEQGQKSRKDKRLETFNSNFNIDLSPEQADLIGSIMESDSYQQLTETYEGIYGEVISAMGEAIEEGIDEINIEQTLNIFNQYNIRPDFDTFKGISSLPQAEFNKLQYDLYEHTNTFNYLSADEYEQYDIIDSIIGNYIDWS